MIKLKTDSVTTIDKIVTTIDKKNTAMICLVDSILRLISGKTMFLEPFGIN
jgi:hypothetical protein